MPVAVTISANGDHLRTVHISRMAAISRTTGRWRYSVLLRDDDAVVDERDWDTGVMFEHVTSDGVELLVSRALVAIAEDRGETTRAGNRHAGQA